MAFCRGPFYGLSAEVKNKVGGHILYLHKVNSIELFFHYPLIVLFYLSASHLGLHFGYACPG